MRPASCSDEPPIPTVVPWCGGWCARLAVASRCACAYRAGHDNCPTHPRRSGPRAASRPDKPALALRHRRPRHRGSLHTPTTATTSSTGATRLCRAAPGPRASSAGQGEPSGRWSSMATPGVGYRARMSRCGRSPTNRWRCATGRGSHANELVTSLMRNSRTAKSVPSTKNPATLSL